MSHLNPSPNQTKTQSKRQNRSERNRKRSERIGEWKKRERPLFPATHHAPSTSIPSPQPTTHIPSPWSLHHRATTIGPPYHPAKTHNPHATTATTKPPTQRRHHRERLAERALIWWERFEFLEREVWVFWERVDEKVNNDPWPTATVAFKALIIPVNFVTSLIFLTFCSSFFIFSIFNHQSTDHINGFLDRRRSLFFFFCSPMGLWCLLEFSRWRYSQKFYSPFI